MVVGDNGILSQAVNASTATDVAETKEAIELAVIGYLDEGGKYTITDVEQAVADAGATLGEDGITVTTAKGNEFDISDLLNEAETVINAKYVAQNASEFYGVEISNYQVDLSATNTEGTNLQESLDSEGITWKIFYSYGSNIYLIASDCVLAVDVPANSSGETPSISSSYEICLVNSVTPEITDSRLVKLNSLYFESYSSYCYRNTYKLRYLMDINVWNIFAGDYADYAIGGRTIEMWCASWNEKGYSPIYCNKVDSNGYCVGEDDEPETTQLSLSTYIENYDDSLYSSSMEIGYWIASPSANCYDYAGDSLLGFNNSVGRITPYSYGSCAGIRPLICLTSTTELEEVSDGVYSIIK